MKRILLIEDEHLAAKRLSKMLHQLDNQIDIIDTLDAVEDAVAWFKNYEHPDLVFCDIQLADGLSFSIFEQIEISCPIVFTTAYDQYAIKAFEVNSIDYLLKPIEAKALERAWQKFQTLHLSSTDNLAALVANFAKANQQKNFKERFLIKSGEQYKYLTINEVAYFVSEDGMTFFIAKNGKRYIVDDKLDMLETTLNPRNFFRINRKFIVHEDCVSKISTYFNSRLILELSPIAKDEVIVARERVGAFKDWLNA